MIITCEKCSKSFKIQDSLIPNEGRELQCGSCNYKWFFKKNYVEIVSKVPCNANQYKNKN